MSSLERAFTKPPLEELKRRLRTEQFVVTCLGWTEPPFRNAYWNHHEPGIYVDIISGEPLFSSLDKFDSGTGWPSFVRPISYEFIRELPDHSHGLYRIEVRSRFGDSHLGHVFDDGPPPTGKRYCINSSALRFIPVDRMEEEGYGEFLEPFLQKGITTIDLSTPTTNPEEVYLAGGCFWGLQHLLRQVPGVLFTEVGYTGGDVWDPTYTHHGTHAEAVRVFFDPERLIFEELLRWFFRMHDPTTIHRQGNDIGPSYRSAIFYKTERQRRIALNFIERLNRLSHWGKPIVTEVEPAGIFFRAEEEHQDYLIKHPGGYTCHYLRPESILGF